MPAHLLSVVLPTHNRPDRLERAAQSVLSQQGAEMELVIVDDASSDRTTEVAERMADDPRVQLLRNATSIGPGGSRNRGIAAARGDLLGFCDDDDTWLPGAASAVTGRFDADAEVGVVTSWHEVVHDETGRTALFRGPVGFGAEHLLWFDLIAIPFGVVRRAMFPEDLAVDPGLPSCEDWDLWLRCARTRPMATIPLALYSYHQHGGGRVTREGSGPVLGRQGFLDKHAAAMPAACRIYHQLVVAQLGRGRTGVREQAVADSGQPASAAVALSVLVAGAMAGTIGARRRDPGLPARMMRALLAGATAVDRGETTC